MKEYLLFFLFLLSGIIPFQASATHAYFWTPLPPANISTDVYIQTMFRLGFRVAPDTTFMNTVAPPPNSQTNRGAILLRDELRNDEASRQFLRSIPDGILLWVQLDHNFFLIREQARSILQHNVARLSNFQREILLSYTSHQADPRRLYISLTSIPTELIREAYVIHNGNPTTHTMNPYFVDNPNRRPNLGIMNEQQLGLLTYDNPEQRLEAIRVQGRRQRFFTEMTLDAGMCVDFVNDPPPNQFHLNNVNFSNSNSCSSFEVPITADTLKKNKSRLFHYDIALFY